eukprot:CAMPEP_0183741700 /NCGR_PEP_ID=MMETSP0737-20130205/62816_1 /TAXON_ID=385413 /ORGANISM="Thalassiosira miniscula, Strain CCMP1093" /LENGTH=99 /DNA_ID=CAMNT_0025977115 /DNA_START=48 /DNA_END=344 /DNA_ORIENTATION=-
MTDQSLSSELQDLEASLDDRSTLTSSLDSIDTLLLLDKDSLAIKSQSKFQKGLLCLKRQNYTLAKSKFNVALRTRIQLHDNDERHLSIAPVYEMLGIAE